MKTPISVPAFRVEVIAPAWTQQQAERIQAQLERMFTGLEVSIVPNVPEPTPASEIFTPVTAPIVAPVDPLLSAVKTNLAGLAPENPADLIAIEAPVAIGQTLRDKHTGETVTVREVSSTSFVWENSNPEAASNAKSGICPFVSFADCYEITSPPLPADGASSAAATGADSSAPVDPEKPADEVPAKNPKTPSPHAGHKQPSHKVKPPGTMKKADKKRHA